MHIPDGFIDPGTSAAAGVVAVGASACASSRRARPSTTSRSRSPAWRPRSSSPCRCSTSPSPAAPAATCSAASCGGARRAVARSAVCRRGARRAGPAVRRRRPVRARPQHREHGAGRRAGAATLLFLGLRAAPPRGQVVVVAASGIAAGLASCWRRWRSRSSTRSAATARRRSATVAGGDGRRARAHRHRRGDHHRDDRRARCWRSDPTSSTARVGTRRTDRPSATPATTAVGGLIAVRRQHHRLLVVGGLVVALALAFFVSPFASSSARRPREGRGRQGLRHRGRAITPSTDGPLADYAVEGVDDDRRQHRSRRAHRRRGHVRRRVGVFAVIARPGRAPIARERARPWPDADRWASSGPASSLYVPRRRVVHRLPPQCKLAATFLFVLAVVSTPREAFWAFGVYAAMLVGVALVSARPARDVCAAGWRSSCRSSRSRSSCRSSAAASGSMCSASRCR